MLARAGAFHAQGALHQAVNKRLDFVDLFGVFHVDQNEQMKIAIADMAHQRGDQSGFGDIFMGLVNALGQTRNRHAHIGDHSIEARPQSA